MLKYLPAVVVSLDVEQIRFHTQNLKVEGIYFWHGLQYESAFAIHQQLFSYMKQVCHIYFQWLKLDLQNILPQHRLCTLVAVCNTKKGFFRRIKLKISVLKYRNSPVYYRSNTKWAENEQTFVSDEHEV